MRRINCYIPIQIRVTGRLTDAQIDQLQTELVRVLAGRIAFADRTISRAAGRISRAAARIGRRYLIRGSRPVSAGVVRRRSAAQTLSVERAWAAEHREGMVTEDGPDHLILWNFDVDGSDLKAEHVGALDRMVKWIFISLLDPAAAVEIEGHASRSGRQRENDNLSIVRANAVFEQLLERRVDGERIHLSYYASSRPWFPNITGAAMARNRRVELRILGMRHDHTPPPRRAPAPPPRRRAAEVEHGPAKWTKFVPGASFAYEWEVPGASIPAGDFILYPKLKVKVRGAIETLSGTAANWTLSKEGLQRAVTAKLPNDLSFQGKLTPEGQLQGGFSFGDVPFKPTIVASADPKAPIKFQLQFSPDPEHPAFEREFELDEGVKVKVEVELEGECGVGLNYVVVGEQVGAGAAEAGGAEVAEGGVLGAVGPVGVGAGVAVIGIAWSGFVAYEMVEAGREGKAWGALTARRSGFAYRIAAESPGAYDFYLQQYESQASGGAWEPMYDGWMAADGAIRAAGSSAPALLQSLKAGAARERRDLHDYVFDLIGGIEQEPADLPRSLDELVTRAH